MTNQRIQSNNPLCLGVEELQHTLIRLSKINRGYPPYNIEQTSDNCLKIILAVAGFKSEDLTITLEDNHLLINGKQHDDQDKERVYLYRGIAARSFRRSFMLDERIDVMGASLDNGLLTIDLQQLIPQKKIIAIDSQIRNTTKTIIISSL